MALPATVLGLYGLAGIARIVRQHARCAIPGKAEENRVSMTPAGVEVMCQNGHEILEDVAIDQGGCFETSKATTHSEPIYTVDGVVHYCVANRPGAVPKTSTMALTNATLPYAVEIANKGWKKAMQENPEVKLGANVVKGQITYKAVAEIFNLDYTPVDRFL